MLNKVALVGRITKDPEVKTLPNNQTSVAKFTLAVDRTFKKGGQPTADFLPIIVFGKQAENCGKYLTKGRMIAVSGRIQTRSWDGQDGKKNYATEIIADEVDFLPAGKGKNDSDEGGAGEDYENYEFNPAEEEEDLPF